MSFTCSLEFKTQVVQLTIVLIFADSAQSRLAAFRNREIQNKCRLLFQTLCFPRINCSLASTWLKLDIFKNRMILFKIAAMPLPTKRFLTTNESFQMRYWMSFYLKGQWNYIKSTLKFPKRLFLYSRYESLKIWCLIIFDVP